MFITSESIIIITMSREFISRNPRYNIRRKFPNITEISTFYSIEFSKDFNLKKKDFEYIRDQLKTMAENKYQGINFDAEIKTDETNNLTLYLSNLNCKDKDVKKRDLEYFIKKAILNIIKKNYNTQSDKSIDLSEHSLEIPYKKIETKYFNVRYDEDDDEDEWWL